VAYWPIK